MKQFNLAKKESLGTRRAGPTFMHNVTLPKTRCGLTPSGASAQNENLWILSSDTYNGWLCHLEKDMKVPHYEVCESKVNAILHVNVEDARRLHDQYIRGSSRGDDR